MKSKSLAYHVGYVGTHIICGFAVMAVPFGITLAMIYGMVKLIKFAWGA